MKECTACRQLLPLNMFAKNKNNKTDGLRSKCRKCVALVSAIWRENNREYLREKGRQYWAERPEKKRAFTVKKYGLSLEEYHDMLAKQGSLCAICHTDNNSGKAFDVDHDHITGKVRGLLCSSCNKGIGSLKDSEKIIESALKYVRSYL